MSDQERNVIANPLYEESGFDFEHHLPSDDDDEHGGGYLDVDPNAEDEPAAHSPAAAQQASMYPRNSFSSPFRTPSFHTGQTPLKEQQATPYKTQSTRTHNILIGVLAVIALAAIIAAVFAINNKTECSATSAGTTGASTSGGGGNSAAGKVKKNAAVICPASKGENKTGCPEVGIATTHWCSSTVKVDPPSDSKVFGLASLDEHCPRQTTFDLADYEDLASMSLTYSCDGGAITVSVYTKDGFEHHLLLPCTPTTSRRERRNSRIETHLDFSKAKPPIDPTADIERMELVGFGDMTVYDMTPVLKSAACRPMKGMARCGGTAAAPWGQCNVLENGGYECDCSDGFTLSEDGSTCIDVNECQTENGGCKHVCLNSVGGFRCSCGDGIVSAAYNEDCDGGEGCSSDCTCPCGTEPDGNNGCSAKCGNGVVDEFENCDAADSNCVECWCAAGYEPSADGDGTCTKMCGNGRLDFGEICDVDSESCKDDCTCAFGTIPDNAGGCTNPCGDSIVQSDFFEMCDNDSPHCKECACEYGYEPDEQGGCASVCGNDVYQPDFNEECDDKNDANCKDCTCTEGYQSDNQGGCQAICGNSIIDLTETCDKPGDVNCVNCNCKFGYLPDGQGGCSHPCTDGAGGEEHGVFCKLGQENCVACECVSGYLPDGNGGCVESCGNGKVDATEGENCDSDTDPNCVMCKCALGYEPKADGSGECQALCGNSVLDPTEECDSNVATCVGCSCAHGYISDTKGGCAKLCGNNVFQPEYNEECDAPQASCVDCRCAAGTLPDNNGACEPACGNGVIDTKFGEECDKQGDTLCTDCKCEPGAEQDPDSTGCRKLCGNLHLDESVNENCDDGSSECFNCRCKSGFLPDGKGGCETANLCGNGAFDASAGEECDDPNDSKCANCQCEFLYRGDGSGKCVKECGDGSVNPLLGEECDSDDEDCINCKCKSGTEPDTNKGCQPVCGNGFVDPNENCDNKDDSNCIDCKCKQPTFIPDGSNGCTTCGNGQWDKAVEQCDSPQSTCVKCKCADGFETDKFGGCRPKCTCDESVTTACYNCQCAAGYQPTGDGGCNPLCGNGKIDDNGLEECDKIGDPYCVQCKCTTSPLDEGNGCKVPPLITTADHIKQINAWAGLSSSTAWSLCYKSSRSMDRNEWFSNCDNKGHVFFVVRVNKGSSAERLIGAYMYDMRSYSSSYYSTNPYAWLFSLTNNYKHTLYRYTQYMYYSHSNYGPTFGGGHDFNIKTDGSGYCNIGHTYRCRTSSYGSSTCRNDFCGNYQFNYDDIEFYVQGSNGGGGGGNTPTTLINQDQWKQVNEWIGFVNSTSWVLCFRQSAHGASSSTFHANCAGKGDLVTVALLNQGNTQRERLIGAYQSISAGNVGYHVDPKAFLFSLTNGRVYEQYQNQQNALYLSSSYYPTFGGGHDLRLGPSSPNCNLGNTYECATGTYGSSTCRDEFCGTYSPSVTDIEVYYRPFAPHPVIATPEDLAQINEWAGLKKDTKWVLCFRDSELHHGNAFMDRCGNSGPTITVALLNAGAGDYERRVGAYAAKPFTYNSGYIDAPGTFLFSLTKGHTYQMFQNFNRAMYWTSSSGGYPPTFGSGHDLFLGTDPNNARCNLGNTFECKVGVYGSTECRNEFCGLYQPKVNDYEVYQLVFDEEVLLADETQIKKINTWAGLDEGTKWKVCYRKSHHGDGYPVFASNCVGKGKAVIITHLNRGSNIERLVGGYTSSDLRNTGGYYSDSGAFLFSLTNDHKYLQYQNTQNAVYGNNNYFPTFGSGHDFYMGTGTPYCNLGSTYRCATSSYGSTACREEFCGAYNPKVDDMEIWIAA